MQTNAHRLLSGRAATPRFGPNARRRAGDLARAAADGLRTVAYGPERRPSWLATRSRAVRRAVVVLLTIATVGGHLLCATVAYRSHPSALAWVGLLALGEVLPLALLARNPLLGWRLGWLTALLTPLMPDDPWGNWPWEPAQIPLLLLAYGVTGLRHGRPALWTMWALMLTLLWIGVPDPENSIGGSIAFTVSTVLLDAVVGRRQATRALRAQTELTRHEQARRAVLEERTRIARELHDVVAHHMSLVSVRAETAPYRHEGVSDPIREEFGAISAMARESLTEMRRLLGVLRSEEPTDSTAHAPHPGLADLPALVDATRSAGTPVELAVSGVDAGVPATVGLSAYRIVQESLSNVRRHAGGAQVTVSVRGDAEGLHVQVSNAPRRADDAPAGLPPDRIGAASGAGEPVRPAGEPVRPAGEPVRPAGEPVRPAGAGHGLAGMRERVNLLGGSLAATPDGTGGFTVRAFLPTDARHPRAGP